MFLPQIEIPLDRARLIHLIRFVLSFSRNYSSLDLSRSDVSCDLITHAGWIWI